MAGYSWIFFVSPDTITEVTATDGVTTVTVQATGGGMTVPFFETSAFPETTEVTLSATGYNKVTAIVGTTSSVTFTEGGYSWGFTAPASSITITNGTNTYTYTGMAIPMGGYSYTVTDFDENDEVTISAVGYNKVTATVGDVTIVMTEMPEVEVLNPNGTNYAIADAKARQQVADLETNVYNDLQNYVTIDTRQTIPGEKAFGASPIIPSPGANDDSTKATTTAWVRTFAKSSGANYMTTISKAGNGYCKFTNGLIVQWGAVTVSKDSRATVTFPTAYSNTDYKVTATVGNAIQTGGGGIITTTTHTATNFVMSNGQDALYDINWIAIGY